MSEKSEPKPEQEWNDQRVRRILESEGVKALADAINADLSTINADLSMERDKRMRAEAYEKQLANQIAAERRNKNCKRIIQDTEIKIRKRKSR